MNNLLAANQGLIDGELVATMEQVAVRMVEEGDNDTAAWLQNVAETLIEELNRALAASREEYGAFLKEVYTTSNYSRQDACTTKKDLCKRRA